MPVLNHKEQKPRKLARTQLKAFTMKLWREQGGLCPLCLQDHIPEGKTQPDVVLDHCHLTGLVRGALGRSCNGAEGKVANAAGRWGAKSMHYDDIIPYLERLVAYLKQGTKPYIYPLHKTEEERRELRNARARKARATRKAAARIKQESKQETKA